MVRAATIRKRILLYLHLFRFRFHAETPRAARTFRKDASLSGPSVLHRSFSNRLAAARPSTAIVERAIMECRGQPETHPLDGAVRLVAGIRAEIKETLQLGVATELELPKAFRLIV